MQDERWSVFTREQIVEKDNSWDLGLIRDDSVLDYNDQPDPVDSAEEAVDLLMSVVKELRALEVWDRWREKENLTSSAHLEEALVPDWEQPYKAPAN